ncbi:MAG: hypothetical protein IKK63_05550 [Clostridia bacterium]|nr:hypothetical protein [Clostridia bacterium]
MYKIIENRNELNEILKTMDKADTNQHIYSAGYTLVLSNINANGNEDEYRAEMAYFIVSDDENGEENVRKEFFDMMIRKECKAEMCLGFEVSMVDETIEILTSETSVKYLFDFWNTLAMTKEMIDWVLNDLAG